ncbi:hypothetical protein BJ878DRAFT_327425 [Calycina marina]|uniref:Uncharacterized protein n=1 Tax=Calycina marina TaxID=1763456 RepID=A0A9P7ZBE4_9HELO|nr:hypothetical protein BJ878DRAFT_327425 [Calycina marina]
MPPPNTPVAHTPRSLSVDFTESLPFHNITVPPPNTPSSALDSPHHNRQYRSRAPQVVEEAVETDSSEIDESQHIDYRALTYADTVNENLICPICKVAFVDPVDTECEHTFCKECIAHALEHNDVCPFDRNPLPQPATLTRSHKIVINQLDSLLVECSSCRAHVPRSMLRNHLDRYCKEALVDCPDKGCLQQVRRKLVDQGCLHNNIACPDCEGIHQEVAMSKHREESCEERQRQCDHCGTNILRCKQTQHEEECVELIVPCIWVQYGCEHQCKRGELNLHKLECNFRLMGPMADILRKEIQTLQSDVRYLTDKEQLQERRIKFLEGGQRESHRHSNYEEWSSQALTPLADSAQVEPLSESTNEYLLNLLGDQERRISQLSSALTELEGKQTMMLFNETVPIKNQIAELQSNQQMTSMHIRWFMNWRKEDQLRLQQQQRRFGGGGGCAGGSGGASESEVDGGGSSSELATPRRSPDSLTRGLVTKL